MRKRLVHKKLTEIFRILSSCPLLNIDEKMLPYVPELTDTVFEQPSSLPDAFISIRDFESLVDRLRNKITGLDHIGYCYRVNSQEKELARIRKTMKNKTLYEMKSNDLAKWYFIGDAATLDPMIELLPTLSNKDPKLPYWMPHIHINLRTQWTAEELVHRMQSIFGNTRKPTCFDHVTYGTYSVRLWLGTVSGMNVMLDCWTNVNDPRWIRAHMLTKV